MTALVIDDEDDIRLLARVGLAASGITVIAAASGREGIRRAREAHPDVILLDMMMPEMDGRATFAHLRADPDTAGIPVMFLTARERSLVDDSLLAAPGVGFLNKPFAPRDLAGKIREFLGGTGGGTETVVGSR